MVNLGHEFQAGCLEGILRGKFDAENEFSAGIGRILGALDLAIPLEHVLLHQGNIVDEREWFFLELSPFLLLLNDAMDECEIEDRETKYERRDQRKKRSTTVSR